MRSQRLPVILLLTLLAGISQADARDVVVVLDRSGMDVSGQDWGAEVLRAGLVLTEGSTAVTPLHLRAIGRASLPAPAPTSSRV